MRPDEVEKNMLVDLIDIDEENRPGPLHLKKGKILKISTGIALVLVRVEQQQMEGFSNEAGDGFVISPVRCLKRAGVAPTEFCS